MADYVAYSRSNYFHVDDVDAFCEDLKPFGFILDEERRMGESRTIAFPEEPNGTLCLLIYDSAGAIDLDEDYEDDDRIKPLLDSGKSGYDIFLDTIQKHILENDACIILEAGHEKMRYVTGAALVITRKRYTWMNMESMATTQARIMLDNDDWTTVCSY